MQYSARVHHAHTHTLAHTDKHFSTLRNRTATHTHAHVLVTRAHTRYMHMSHAQQHAHARKQLCSKVSK